MVRAANCIAATPEPERFEPIVQNYNGGAVPESFKGLRLRMVFITPEKAMEMLGTHTNFRNLDEKKARQYAEVMARGEWGFFPPICLGQGGRVQDGQHRLLCGAPHKSRYADFRIMRTQMDPSLKFAEKTRL